MNNDEFLATLNDLYKENNIESYNKAIEIIDKELSEKKTDIPTKKLELLKLNAQIGILQNQVNELGVNDYKQIINLRGKIIKLYKKAEKKADDINTKYKFRYEQIQEIKKQKEILKEYKIENKDKISIPQKVGLTIKEIAKSITIFMKEHDVLTKVINVGKETLASISGSTAIIFGFQMYIYKMLGITLSLSMVSSLAPLLAYSGLASIIRNFTSKTGFEEYVYQQSDEYKAKVQDFMEQNKALIKEVAKLTKEKENLEDNEKLIELNENLIEYLDKLTKSTKIKGIKENFALQALTCFRENKDCCESIKNDYLNELSDDKEKYKLYNKKLMKINFEIFKRSNSLKEALKISTKNTGKNLAIIVVAKTILSQIAPSIFKVNGIESFIIPFAFAILNGIIDIPTFKKKLKYKETEYQGKIDAKNKKRIEEILSVNNKVSVMA